MSEIRSKEFNHFISVVSIAVFCLSIVCVGIFGFMFFNNYQENLRLKEEYDRMQQEYQEVQDIYENTDENGYYHVYSDGELVIYDVGGTIIIK